MGKWTLGRDGENACMIYEGAEPVAQVYGLWMHSALSTLEEAARLNPKSYAVPLARARLIAAAPAMAEALERAQALVGLLTVRQVIEAGDKAIDAAGLNPWAMNEGLATGDERIGAWWIDAALASAKGTRGDET